MTIKQLNRRQIKWTKFLVEFNFRIIYRFEAKNTKFDSFTRRFQNFFVDDFDERRQFNNQIIFKIDNFEAKMHNVIKLNEKIHQFETQTIKLIMMIYFEIVQFMILKILEFDFDDENFDNENIVNETFVVESSTINVWESRSKTCDID